MSGKRNYNWKWRGYFIESPKATVALDDRAVEHMRIEKIFTDAGYKDVGGVSKFDTECWLIDPLKKTFKRKLEANLWPHSWTKRQRAQANAVPRTFKTIEEFEHTHRGKINSKSFGL